MSDDKPFKRMLCSYDFRGAEWAFEIKAESFEDAEARLAAIRMNGSVDGEHVLTIPVGPEDGPLGRFLRWWLRARADALDSPKEPR
jgi:hypothetical protein